MGKPTKAQGSSIARSIDEAEFSKMFETAWKRIWRRFVAFGHLSAGFIGILMLIRAIKLIIDTVIHRYAIHTVYGWTRISARIGAIWDSVTNL